RLVVIPLAVGIGLFTWRLASGGGGGDGKNHQRAAFVPAMPHVRVSTPVATTPRPAPLQRAQIVFAATRGPCWLSVRRGSATGPVLYERMLEPGQHASFAGARLWIRIGAPWNLDATLNGKRVQLPATLGDVLVTPGALRSL